MATNKSPKLQSATTHFMAKRDKAIAELDIYLNSAVGVGEHPHVMEEIFKLFEEVDSASSVLRTIEDIIDEPSESPLDTISKLINSETNESNIAPDTE